tara:strand:+ start:266 stop:424 length:159 start_codon:yes stop_codon:yes gene_type:complete
MHNPIDIMFFKVNGVSSKKIHVKGIKTNQPREKDKNLAGHTASVVSYKNFVP